MDKKNCVKLPVASLCVEIMASKVELAHVTQIRICRDANVIICALQTNIFLPAETSSSWYFNFEIHIYFKMLDTAISHSLCCIFQRAFHQMTSIPGTE